MTYPKSTRYIFTDGSVNPQTNIGYGAYLVIDESQLDTNIHVFFD